MLLLGSLVLAGMRVKLPVSWNPGRAKMLCQHVTVEANLLSMNRPQYRRIAGQHVTEALS
jgi:hypothetical protein